MYCYISLLVMAFVGNKIDLDDGLDGDQRVPFDQAAELAHKYNAILKLTSAKENRGVQELFNAINSRVNQLDTGFMQSGFQSNIQYSNIQKQ